MSVVRSLLSDPCLSLQTKQNALNRTHSDPGLPSTTPTASFWLTEPHPTLSNTQSASLPPSAEIIIIGSGISATSIARTLLLSQSPSQSQSAARVGSKAQLGRPAVAILEARDICAGATGRNGGHILETGEEFAELEREYGVEAAVRLMRFRLGHLKTVIGIAAGYEGLTEEADVREVEFLSVYFDEEGWKGAVESVRRLKQCLGEEVERWRVLGRGEIPEEFGLPHACGVIAGPAGALWPYKFVTGLLARMKNEYPDDLVIESHTPITSIQTLEEDEHGLRYAITTPRGTIRARHIIHCTNGHVGHLVPGLRGRIYPIRGQMSAQKPGSRFRWQGTEHSWIFNYDRGFDYLTQLPAGRGGRMMFGGGFAQGKDRGIADLGVSTDDELSVYVDIHLSGALGAVFGRQNWGSPGKGVEMMWTGNMGFSADGLPWVGILSDSLTGRKGQELEEQGGEWISCAFSGEGMVQAWLCGEALGMMLLRDGYGRKEEDVSWFPGEMLVTEERIQRAVLPRVVASEETPGLSPSRPHAGRSHKSRI